MTHRSRECAGGADRDVGTGGDLWGNPKPEQDRQTHRPQSQAHESAQDADSERDECEKHCLPYEDVRGQAKLIQMQGHRSIAPPRDVNLRLEAARHRIPGVGRWRVRLSSLCLRKQTASGRSLPRWPDGSRSRRD